MILDGRNRYRACLELDLEPETKEYNGDDPTAYVVSLNLHRRHLNESQRALVAARLAKMQPGRPRKNASRESVTQPVAAEALHVGRATVQKARKVLEKAEKACIVGNSFKFQPTFEVDVIVEEPALASTA